MKATITAVMIALGTSGAMAGSYYHGFGVGNPEINPSYWVEEQGMAAAPSGDSGDFDRYHGIAKGNPDMFNTYDVPKSSYTSGMQLPDIYGGFDDGHPDLMW